jgi:hypothetical protein
MGSGNRVIQKNRTQSEVNRVDLRLSRGGITLAPGLVEGSGLGEEGGERWVWGVDVNINRSH